MGDILGIGTTHYPPGLVPDEYKPWPLARMLHTDPRIPPHLKDHVLPWLGSTSRKETVQYFEALRRKQPLNDRANRIEHCPLNGFIFCHLQKQLKPLHGICNWPHSCSPVHVCLAPCELWLARDAPTDVNCARTIS